MWICLYTLKWCEMQLSGLMSVMWIRSPCCDVGQVVLLWSRSGHPVVMWVRSSCITECTVCVCSCVILTQDISTFQRRLQQQLYWAAPASAAEDAYLYCPTYTARIRSVHTTCIVLWFMWSVHLKWCKLHRRMHMTTWQKLTDPTVPEKSWNLSLDFLGPEKSWNWTEVLKKLWKSSEFG